MLIPNILHGLKCPDTSTFLFNRKVPNIFLAQFFLAAICTKKKNELFLCFSSLFQNFIIFLFIPFYIKIELEQKDYLIRDFYLSNKADCTF